MKGVRLREPHRFKLNTSNCEVTLKVAGKSRCGAQSSPMASSFLLQPAVVRIPDLLDGDVARCSARQKADRMGEANKV